MLIIVHACSLFVVGEDAVHAAVFRTCVHQKGGELETSPALLRSDERCTGVRLCRPPADAE